MPQFGQQCSIKLKVLSGKDAKYLQNFSCGNKEIDRYFRDKALKDKTAVTYLYLDQNADALIACITLSCSAIFTEEVDVRSTVLSAMEIKYLAVDKNYQHLPYYQGKKRPTLSDMIFDNMIWNMRRMSLKHIGASKIVLYSVKRAITFYERHGFKKFRLEMYGDQGDYVISCCPMYFDLND